MNKMTKKLIADLENVVFEIDEEVSVLEDRIKALQELSYNTECVLTHLRSK